MIEDYLLPLVAAAAGAGLCALVLRARMVVLEARHVSEATQHGETREALARAQDRLEQLSSAHDAAVQARVVLETEAKRLPELSARLDALIAERERLLQRNAEIETLLHAEREAAREKLAILSEAREQLALQFRRIAQEIFDEKSRVLREESQNGLGLLLEPLKERLKGFQEKVEQAYVTDTRDRSAMAEQVRQLMELNRTLSQEARNLTRALKGEQKTQGIWGELVLERILESSGLRRDHEYQVQPSFGHEAGTSRPDVIIQLPGERQLVVDAKVSLMAFERHVRAENEAERHAELRRHLDSVRAHMRGLADKNYQNLPGLTTLDCVLLFIPIEPAFMLAVTHDRELFDDAWRRNVLLVSPSTLLFVVRTVAQLWRQEQQNRNTQEIARRGAELYDKFCGFVADMEKLGERLDQARDAFEAARGKLTTGRGNLVRQAELLRELGVKPTKALPKGALERAREDEPS